MSDVAWEAWELAVERRDPTIITGDVLAMVQAELESLRAQLRKYAEEQSGSLRGWQASTWTCPRCSTIFTWWPARSCPPTTG